MHRDARQPRKQAPQRHVVGVAVTDDMPVFELAVPCEIFGIDRSDLAAPWYELRNGCGRLCGHLEQCPYASPPCHRAVTRRGPA